RYAAAGLALGWRGAAEEAWILADGMRLEQVLDNLLVNALRYVPAGGHVELAMRRVEGPPAQWRLTGSDDGPGPPSEELSRVVERFCRGAGTRGDNDTRNGAGSGLGLAIVRRIVERHGGSVHARAESPRGLAIVVDLPALG